MEDNNEFSIEIDEAELNAIDNIYNAKMDVYVRLKNGFSLRIVVGTPQNLQHLMEKDKVNFYGPGLTRIIVQEAIKFYIADTPNYYWLKLYHFVYHIDPTIFDKLQVETMKGSAETDLLIGLDLIKAKINKLDTLDTSKKLNLVDSLNQLYKHLSIITKKY